MDHRPANLRPRGLEPPAPRAFVLVVDVRVQSAPSRNGHRRGHRLNTIESTAGGEGCRHLVGQDGEDRLQTIEPSSMSWSICSWSPVKAGPKVTPFRRLKSHPLFVCGADQRSVPLGAVAEAQSCLEGRPRSLSRRR